MTAVMTRAPSDRIDEPVSAQVTEPHDGGPALTPLALALVVLGSFMVVLDFSIVNVALPSIATDLGFRSNSVQWVVTAYAITFGGLLILGGRVADNFGRRRLFVLGLLLFAGASLLAGLVHDAASLVVARTIQGVGAAIVAPASLSLITARIAEGPRRTRALGIYGATASVGFVAGQVLGGVLVEFTTWRAIFLVNVPVGLVASVLALRLIAPDRPTRRIRLDLFGGLLITAAVGTLVLAISEGPDLGWGDWTVLSGVAVSVLSFAGFVAHERRTPAPLVDFRLVRRRPIRTAATLTFLLGAWNAGELVVLSVYMQRVLHDSPLVAGLIVAPQGLAGFCAGFFGARLIGRVGLHRWLVATTAAAGAGFLVLTRLPISGHYSPLFNAVVLIGFGTAGTMFGTNVMAAAGVAGRDQGLVGGVVNTTRQVGAAFGVAVLVAIAGSDPRSGPAAIGGDRAAMFVAGMAGLVAALVAWSQSGTAPRTGSSHHLIPITRRRTS